MSSKSVTVKFDGKPLDLTPRVVDALIEVMRATCAMHAEHEPEFAECWRAGRCEIVDWGASDGIVFTYGWSPAEFGQREAFVVVAADPEPSE